MIKIKSFDEINTWLSMILRGLIMLILIFYAGAYLDPISSTIFLILISILSFQGMLDFGFIPTFVRAIAYLKESKKESHQLIINNFDFSNISMDDLIEVFRWIYLRLTIFFFLLIFIIGYASLSGLIIQLQNTYIGWLSFFATTIGSVFLFSYSRYAAILTGLDKIAIQKKIEIIVNFPTTILLIIALLFQINFFLILCILNLSYIFLFFLTRYEVKKQINIPKLGIINYGLAKNIFSSAWKSGLGVIMTMGTINGSALVIANIVSSEIASSYLIAQRLIVTISSYSYVPFQVVIPKISTAFAYGRISNAMSQAFKAKKIVLSLFLVGSLSVLIFTEYLLPKFNVEFSFIGINIWLIMIMYAFIERAGAINIQAQTINNNVKWHIANGVTGVIMLTAIPFLYDSFSLVGIPLSFFLGYMFFYYPYSIYQLYKQLDYFNFKSELIFVILPTLIMFIIYTNFLIQ